MHAQDKTLSFYSKSEVNELIKKLKALKSGESFAHPCIVTQGNITYADHRIFALEEDEDDED